MAKFFWLVLLLISCGEEVQRQNLRIVSWNVHNLFDLEWQGTEYPEYDPRPRKSGPAKWTAERLQQHLKALSPVLNRLDADVYALIEVESEAVLQQLNLELDRPFAHSLLLPQQDQAINMALLSRLPIVRSARHEVGFLGKNRQLRAIVEVELEATNPEHNLILFLNHWKSQRGGAAATAPARRKAAAVLNQRAKELQSGAYIIALGDFNEPVDTYWNQEEEHYEGSFRPWNQDSTKQKVMHIAADPFRKLATERLTWFSPWFAYACSSDKDLEINDWNASDCLEMGALPQELGSYFFRGRWQTIDHIFLNAAFFPKFQGAQIKAPQLGGWQFASFAVAELPISTQHISDHLPLVLQLEYF